MFGFSRTSRVEIQTSKPAIETLESRCMMSVVPATAPLHILIYGASYINGYQSGKGNVQPLPTMLKEIASAAGFAAPVITNVSTDGKTLAWAVSHFKASQVSSLTDFVIFQDQSNRMANITYNNIGNPVQSEKDAMTLYQKVKAIAPHAVPIVFEDWGRSALDTAELKKWYPSLTLGKPTPYAAAANQMQAEIKKNTAAEVAYLNTAAGARVTRTARVGDAFAAKGLAVELFDTDHHHASNEGYVLCGLVNFEAIYHVKTAGLDLTSVFSKHGVSATLGKSLETLADSV